MAFGGLGPASIGSNEKNDGTSRGGGFVAQYSDVTAKSTVPLFSSGLCK